MTRFFPTLPLRFGFGFGEAVRMQRDPRYFTLTLGAAIAAVSDFARGLLLCAHNDSVALKSHEELKWAGALAILQIAH